jgi:hypothetical protein
MDLWNHRFLPRARTLELPSPCWRASSQQTDAGSALVVGVAGRKSAEGPQANSWTPEAQWLPQGSRQIPDVAAQGNGDALLCARWMPLPLQLQHWPHVTAIESPIRHSSCSGELDQHLAYLLFF